MTDAALAQARRLYHHAKTGGTVTADDLARLVTILERMQAGVRMVEYPNGGQAWLPRKRTAKDKRDA
jgi:hypothetical protein